MLRRLYTIVLLVGMTMSKSLPAQSIDDEFQLPIPIAVGEQTVENDSHIDSADSGLIVESQVVDNRPANASTRTASLPLPPRGGVSVSPDSPEFEQPVSESLAWGSPWRTISSLAVVLGLFLVFVWIVRRHRVPALTEQQVFQTIGRTSLLGRQAHIVQFGDKLLVLAKTSNGLEKLTELTNPQEVQRVTHLCLHGSSAQVAVGVQEAMLGRSQFVQSHA